MGMLITIYSTNHIGTEECAGRFLRLMEEYRFEIEKINLSEPANETYSLIKAKNMWVTEEPGLYDSDSDKMIGKSGGMYGKGKGFWYQVHWWKHPSKKTLNYLTVYLSKKVFKQKTREIFLFFTELVENMDATYGYVTNEESRNRQHVTGTLRERLPGVFWLNYFSLLFVDYLGKNSISEFSWKEILENKNGIITQLAETPDEKVISELEEKAHNYFGESKFDGSDANYPNLLL